MTDAAVQISGLRHAFAGNPVLHGVDLRLARGDVLGLLGPNGAGKTTVVRIVTTLLRADHGQIRVDGVDVRRDPDLVRAAVGVSGQDVSLDENLTGRQNLRLVARLHGAGRRDADRRTDELLERFGLTGMPGERPVGRWSGGMRRRLDLAAALVGRPSVLVLDEPTTGLDPRGRATTWDLVDECVAEGASVLLTTQYLEEADRLADRIALLDDGTVVAEGPLEELKSRLGGMQVSLVVDDVRGLPAAVRALGRVSTAPCTADEQTRRVSAPVTGPAALASVLDRLGTDGVGVTGATLGGPTLDDVFLRLTGNGRGGAS